MAAYVPAAEGLAEPVAQEPVSDLTIPADIAARLSEDQLSRLKAILASRTTPHAVDYRVTTSILGRRFYVALFGGREARSWERLKNEKQIRPLSAVFRDAVVVSVTVTIVLSILIGLMVLGLHLLRPYTGIELFPR